MRKGRQGSFGRDIYGRRPVEDKAVDGHAVAPLGLTPFWGFTHGSAFVSTVGYFLGAPSGLGFVGFFGLYRAGGV